MRTTLFALGGFVGLMLAVSPSGAQDYGRYQDRSDYSGTPETLEVIAPRYHRPQHSAIDAPIVRVSMSRRVYTGDLDLRDNRDAHRLRNRLVGAATNLCKSIDVSYPAVVEDNTRCDRYATVNALQEVDAAIHRARGYPDE